MAVVLLFLRVVKSTPLAEPRFTLPKLTGEGVKVMAGVGVVTGAGVGVGVGAGAGAAVLYAATSDTPEYAENPLVRR
jgi:hypothetical protein